MRAALGDLLLQDGEEGVVLDAFLDLRLVVQGEIGGDGAGEAVGGLGGVDQRGHGRSLTGTSPRAQISSKHTASPFSASCHSPAARDSSTPSPSLTGTAATVGQ